MKKGACCRCHRVLDISYHHLFPSVLSRETGGGKDSQALQTQTRGETAGTRAPQARQTTQTPAPQTCQATQATQAQTRTQGEEK